MKTAPEFLEAASRAIGDRAAQRDCPTGERSMARAVDAFNAMTGHDLTEVDGWWFMVLLKMARAQNGGLQPDDFTDAAAYCALGGEAAVAEDQACQFMALLTGEELAELAEEEFCRGGDEPEEQDPGESVSLGQDEEAELKNPPETDTSPGRVKETGKSEHEEPDNDVRPGPLRPGEIVLNGLPAELIGELVPKKGQRFVIGITWREILCTGHTPGGKRIKYRNEKGEEWTATEDEFSAWMLSEAPADETEPEPPRKTGPKPQSKPKFHLGKEPVTTERPVPIVLPAISPERQAEIDRMPSQQDCPCGSKASKTVERRPPDFLPKVEYHCRNEECPVTSGAGKVGA